MRKIPLFLSTTLLVGCSGLMPASMQKGASLILTPRIQEGGYQTQATVSVYTSTSIDHLTIKLFEGTTELASKTIPQGELVNPITFSNLRNNTTYTVKSYAYLANSAQISVDGGSSRTFTTLTDDRPTILSLPVLLSDFPFNGIGTSSIQVTPGGYSYAGSEAFGLLFKGSVNVNVDGRADLLKARFFLASTGAEVGAVQTTSANPTLTFSELQPSTNYNVWVEAHKLGGVYASQSVAISVGTETNPAPQNVSFSLPYYIDTVVGNGNWEFAGDGGSATSAALSGPYGVVFDAQGNYYIADYGNNRIRKVNISDGKISTVVGDGGWTFNGDDKPATSASLGGAAGMALDAQGNLYIADDQHHRIRKVTPSGTITTVAGNGVAAYSGDGGAATAASLNTPSGVACDAQGNLYISDYANDRIRKVNSSDGKISTVAGNGVYGFAGDGGAATSASLRNPYGIALDPQGNIYVVDCNNSRVRKVTPSGTITTVAGNGDTSYAGDGGLATSTGMKPYGVACDAQGNFFIADYGNNRILKVNALGTISTVGGNGVGAYSGDGGLATAAKLWSPNGVSCDAQGILYVSDYNNSCIRRLK